MLFSIVVSFLVVYFLIYPKSKWEASVSMFTGMIMLFAVLGDNDQIWIIDHRVIATLFLFYAAYTYRVTTINKKDFDTYKKIALFLAIFLFVIVSRQIEFKTHYINDRLVLGDQFKRLLRDSIYVFAVFIIIKRLYDKRTLRGVENGILLGLVLALVSMLFYDFFDSMGFSLHMGDSVDKEIVNRQTGFLGENPNSASLIFNTVIGYVFARNEKKMGFSKIHLTLLIVSVIGVLIVASRAGLVALSLITFLYIYRSTSNIKAIISKSIVVLMVGFIGFHFFGDYMLHRVDQYQTGEDNTLETRQEYWLLYLNDIVENPEYLIIGNLGNPTYGRDVHNKYIQYLFYAGLIVFSIIMYNFWKIYKYRNKYSQNEGYYTPIYMLFALLVSWITGAGTVSFWFVLLIAASAGVPKQMVSNKPDNSLIND